MLIKQFMNVIFIQMNRFKLKINIFRFFNYAYFASNSIYRAE